MTFSEKAKTALEAAQPPIREQLIAEYLYHSKKYINSFWPWTTHYRWKQIERILNQIVSETQSHEP